MEVSPSCTEDSDAIPATEPPRAASSQLRVAQGLRKGPCFWYPPLYQRITACVILHAVLAEELFQACLVFRVGSLTDL